MATATVVAVVAATAIAIVNHAGKLCQQFGTHNIRKTHEVFRIFSFQRETTSDDDSAHNSRSEKF
jgi:hypothetical protein